MTELLFAPVAAVLILAGLALWRPDAPARPALPEVSALLAALRPLAARVIDFLSGLCGGVALCAVAMGWAAAALGMALLSAALSVAAGRLHLARR